MKQTNKFLFILLFLLAGATAAFFYFGRNSKSTIEGWDRAFKVEDVTSIQKIFLADRRDNQTTLERSGDGWIYNGKFPANPNVMKSLLEAISLVELQYIPPASATQPMVEDLASNGIKVELYGKKDKLLKTYYVGGTTPDERGTIMIMEGSNQPYVTQIPNMVGALRVRYAVTGDLWRDKSLFLMKPEDITFVSVEYPKMKNRSFVLSKDGEAFSVRPFYEVTPAITNPYKNGSAENYLQGFKGIIAEAFENDNPLRDTIVQRLPFSIITVRTKDNAEQVVRLHPAISKNADMNDPPPVYERYLAEVFPNNDFMLVQDRNITRILWGYDFFYIDESK
ncbi:MAG: DUF4340 domain-containing protein [Saprospirales bacterium]|nr:DUF4340 domain-containing protein [Saprospirales bacterium]